MARDKFFMAIGAILGEREHHRLCKSFFSIRMRMKTKIPLLCTSNQEIFCPLQNLSRPFLEKPRPSLRRALRENGASSSRLVVHS